MGGNIDPSTFPHPTFSYKTDRISRCAVQYDEWWRWWWWLPFFRRIPRRSTWWRRRRSRLSAAGYRCSAWVPFLVPTPFTEEKAVLTVRIGNLELGLVGEGWMQELLIVLFVSFFPSLFPFSFFRFLTFFSLKVSIISITSMKVLFLTHANMIFVFAFVCFFVDGLVWPLVWGFNSPRLV